MIEIVACLLLGLVGVVLAFFWVNTSSPALQRDSSA